MTNTQKAALLKRISANASKTQYAVNGYTYIGMGIQSGFGRFGLESKEIYATASAIHRNVKLSNGFGGSHSGYHYYLRNAYVKSLGYSSDTLKDQLADAKAKEDAANKALKLAEQKVAALEQKIKDRDTTKVGQKYSLDGDTYIVALVQSERDEFYTLVDISDGRVYHYMTKNIEDVFDGDKADFKLVK